jgi:ribosomal RNA-processing protein 7
MAPSSSSSKPRRRRQQATAAPLIKGYLPVRLCLPTTTDEGQSDETFFYVKEHRDNNNTTTSTPNKNSTTTTLFVANAPVIPPISTKLLLKSIFGRYGDVTRVTVVPNPRHFKHQQEASFSSAAMSRRSVDYEGIRWTDQFAAPSYFHHAAVLEEQGRFAHVVFSSTKELKACLASLHQVMAAAPTSGGDKHARTSNAGDSDSSSSHDDDDDDEGSHDGDSSNDEESQPHSPGLVLDPIELQTMADETDRLYREEHRHRRDNNSDDDSDDDDDNERTKQRKKPSRVLRVAERYRETCCTTSRDRKDLLEECNRVMQQYDDEQARALAATTGGDGEPLVDDDGFVTVSYGNNSGAVVGVGSSATGKRALDEAPVHEQGQKRRKGQKRSRGSKKGPGALELADFYRFQTKENRKKTLHELREQFEQDLAKVQKMKQERQYRPF